jgi:hypothetical protein
LAWASAAGAPGRAPAAYVVEAGTASGAANVAIVETPAAATRYAAPVPNGTLHVRVRARNACGDSTASDEFVVPVSNSVSRDTPNPLVLLETVNAVRERLAGTAFVRVMGVVRNGWLAAPASFVGVTATFDGPAGEAPESAFAFVNGGSGRLVSAGLTTDTVLAPGADGCFLAFARFPSFEVTGVRLDVSSEAFDVEPLRGALDLRDLTQEADPFGDLQVSGRVTNVGDVPARDPVAWLTVVDAGGRMLDCDATPVRDASLERLPDDVLMAGAAGTFVTGTETVFVADAQVRAWVDWREPDDDGPAVTPRYRELRETLADLLAVDEQESSPQARAALRDALRDEALAIARAVR